MPGESAADDRVPRPQPPGDVAGRVPPRLDDPHVVAQFADLVGTEERLKMLCLMTLVDVGAVSRTTLTPWKEELLWRVYVETYNRLTLGYADELVEGIHAGSVSVHRRPARTTSPSRS